MNFYTQALGVYKIGSSVKVGLDWSLRSSIKGVQIFNHYDPKRKTKQKRKKS